jgi:hypothetical protein
MEEGEIFPKVTEANKTKADKDDNLDKLEMRFFARGDLQKKMHPHSMEYPLSIPYIPQVFLELWQHYGAP